MDLVIENKFIELQRKTTHVLVDQKVMLSDQKKIDMFLDKVIDAKNTHAKLIADYRIAIEIVVSFLEKSQPVEELVSVAESINNLVATTSRLIGSLGEARLKDCFAAEIKEYQILLNDIDEILADIQNRINHGQEMMDLLDSL